MRSREIEKEIKTLLQEAESKEGDRIAQWRIDMEGLGEEVREVNEYAHELATSSNRKNNPESVYPSQDDQAVSLHTIFEDDDVVDDGKTAEQ